MNEEQTLIDTIIDKLQPTPAEYMNDTDFMHRMEYACELDNLSGLNYINDGFVEHINKVMASKSSNAPEHEACTDVASTIESLIPSYAGKFVY